MQSSQSNKNANFLIIFQHTVVEYDTTGGVIFYRVQKDFCRFTRYIAKPRGKYSEKQKKGGKTIGV